MSTLPSNMLFKGWGTTSKILLFGDLKAQRGKHGVGTMKVIFLCVKVKLERLWYTFCVLECYSK